MKPFLYSVLVIVPLLLPFFAIIFSQGLKDKEHTDFTVVSNWESEKTAFTRFYPRKLFSVGIYIDDISGINFADRSFDSKFVFWAKNFFERSANDRSQLGKDPFNIINAADLDIRWRAASYVKNDPDSDNSRNLDDPFVSYISYNVKGKLAQEFYLEHYPFDEHKLKIILEPAYQTAEDMMLWVDPNSLVAGHIDLGEFKITSFTGRSTLHTKRSDFSDPVLITKGAIWNISPRVTFSVNIKRNPFSVLIKTIVPLLILLLMAYSNFFVDPQLFDAKNAMAVTGFLAAAALHWTSGGELGNIGYLTAIDEFFLFSYALFFLVAIESVVSYNRFQSASRADISHLNEEKRVSGKTSFFLPLLKILFPVFLASSWYFVILSHLK
ncbi:MAG: hypothetical protein H8D96_19880 [Desulfobacterales bacterium]|uniref:Neurotransmitter-gated ion-channel ligand-binding domain-containing protein n=1 Tax=Candidatus Desulfatibia vada TaxID=2841696 RepID=A0A8J6NVL6_9BACT|nr:hypothetical protein [Candidatus Desulfatibia vada]MBL6970487.1 hypothetical protein [Desulfobacterales bacterium]